MTSAELLADAFGRVREIVEEVVDDLSPEQLASQVATGANSIAWLVWHLTRVQDDHVAGVAGTEQVWTESGWADRFALPLPASDTGYDHGPKEMAAVKGDAAMLRGYHHAVCEATLRFVAGLRDGDLERIVDERWDPPVTMGVRLVSVVADDLQHAGQAAYVRGILTSR